MPLLSVGSGAVGPHRRAVTALPSCPRTRERAYWEITKFLMLSLHAQRERGADLPIFLVLCGSEVGFFEREAARRPRHIPPAQREPSAPLLLRPLRL
jgi:hypothetical protein